MKTSTRTNDRITSKEVRLIDEKGEQLGIVAIDAAMERARSKTLDLVEVAPDADPPVCRIMDFTKYIYEQKRKQKLAKKKTTRTEVKEVKFRPNIDPHDFGIKVRHIREFLEKGHKIKVTLRFRAREMRHQEIGQMVLKRLVDDLREIATVEAEGRQDSGARMISIMISPKKTVPTK